MSLSDVFNIAGSAMNAQSVRLNVTASNLANAGSVHGDPTKVYRARQPVFASFSLSLADQTGSASVRLKGIVESDTPLNIQYQPNHPDAAFKPLSAIAKVIIKSPDVLDNSVLDNSVIHDS